ncbi:hypothetical protein BBC27_05430 [Acidithiobacillus ferrivorans]|uniref:Uncharacterized protein n=1 Tax=Acidithiobacillus ferrivorans TaxID=160808 RepID=A0A1B9C1X4_9PROT|nr:hypothetical protein BBC27_05430 [Acidithiobacillus ferrivorans]
MTASIEPPMYASALVETGLAANNHTIIKATAIVIVIMEVDKFFKTLRFDMIYSFFICYG